MRIAPIRAPLLLRQDSTPLPVEVQGGADPASMSALDPELSGRRTGRLIADATWSPALLRPHEFRCTGPRNSATLKLVGSVSRARSAHIGRCRIFSSFSICPDHRPRCGGRRACSVSGKHQRGGNRITEIFFRTLSINQICNTGLVADRKSFVF